MRDRVRPTKNFRVKNSFPCDSGKSRANPFLPPNFVSVCRERKRVGGQLAKRGVGMLMVHKEQKAGLSWGSAVCGFTDDRPRPGLVLTMMLMLSQ